MAEGRTAFSQLLGLSSLARQGKPVKHPDEPASEFQKRRSEWFKSSEGDFPAHPSIAAEQQQQRSVRSYLPPETQAALAKPGEALPTPTLGTIQEKIRVPVSEVYQSKYLNPAMDEAEAMKLADGKIYHHIDPQEYRMAALEAFKAGDQKEYKLLLKHVHGTGKSEIESQAADYAVQSENTTAGLNSQIIDVVNNMSEGELRSKLEEASDRFYAEDQRIPRDVGEMRRDLAGIYVAEVFDMPSPKEFGEVREDGDYKFISDQFLETDDEDKIKSLSGPGKDPRIMIGKLGWKSQDVQKIPGKKRKSANMTGDFQPRRFSEALQIANRKMEKGLDPDVSMTSIGEFGATQPFTGQYFGKAGKAEREQAVAAEYAQTMQRFEDMGAAREYAVQSELKKSGMPTQRLGEPDEDFQKRRSRWYHGEPTAEELRAEDEALVAHTAIPPAQPQEGVPATQPEKWQPNRPSPFADFDPENKDAVKYLQEYLVWKGYNLSGTEGEAGVKSDEGTMPTRGLGVFGPRTKAAFKADQKEMGLKPTGEMDPETIAKLNDFATQETIRQQQEQVPEAYRYDPTAAQPKALGAEPVPSKISETPKPPGAEALVQPGFGFMPVPDEPKEGTEATAGGLGGFVKKLKGWSPGAGSMTALLGLGELARYGLSQAGPASQYAKRRVAALESEEKTGFRDRALEQAERKEGMAAIRGLGESTLREQEKAMAMQPRTSAGRLQQMREGSQRELYKASRGLEQDVQARKMGRAQQKKQELESMYAYQQQQREAGLKRLTAGASQLAGQYGKIKAAEAQFDRYNPALWIEKFKKAGWKEEDAQKAAMQMAKIGAEKNLTDRALSMLAKGIQPTDPKWLSTFGNPTKQLLGL